MDRQAPFRWSVVPLHAGQRLDVTLQMSHAGPHLFDKGLKLVDVEVHGLQRYPSPYLAHNISASSQLNHKVTDLLGHVLQMRVKIIKRYLDILLLGFEEFEGDEIYAAVVVELLHL